MIRTDEDIYKNAYITFFISTFPINNETTFENNNLILDDLNKLKYYLDILHHRKDTITNIRIITKNIEQYKSKEYLMNLLLLLNSYYIPSRKRNYIRLSLYSNDFFKKIPIEWILRYFKFQVLLEVDDSCNHIYDDDYIFNVNKLQNYFLKYKSIPNIFYHINFTDKNSDFYLKLYNEGYFKNKPFLKFNILHPTVNKFSKYDEYPWNELLYDTKFIGRTCNIYSDKVAIDLINDKIGKCFKRWNHSSKIPLTDSNFHDVISFKRTDIFSYFDKEMCSNCVCYSLKTVFYD